MTAVPRTMRYLLPVGGGILALVFLYLVRDLVAQNLSGAVTVFLLPAMAAQTLAVALFILQWTLVVRWLGFPLHYRTMAGIYFSASIVESLTPSVKAGGEVTKLVLLNRRAGIPSGNAAAAVVVQKTLSAVVFLCIAGTAAGAMAMTAGAGFLADIPRGGVRVPAGGAVLAGSALLVTRRHFSRNRPPSPGDTTAASSGVRARLRTLATELYSGMTRLSRSPRRLLTHMFLSMVIWSLFPLTLALVARGLEHPIPWVSLGAVTFLSYLAGMIPLLPGGIGSVDAAMVFLLCRTGIPLQEAVTMTLAFRLASFWYILTLSLCFTAGRHILLFMQRYQRAITRQIPNVLTFGNLLLGTTAILLCINGVPPLYCSMAIVAAALFDAFDGWAARKLNAESRLGKELDSLADLASFGVAPVVLLYAAGGYSHVSGAAASLIYVAAAAFRLGRYNISAPAAGFSGLPITAAGIIIALRVLVFPASYAWSTWGDPTLVVLLAVAMASTIPVPRIRLSRSAPILAALWFTVSAWDAASQPVRAVTEQFPPYSYEQHGEIGGISVDIVREVLRVAGMNASIEVLPWRRAYRQARQRENVLFFSVGRTPERETHFQWIGPIVPYVVSFYRASTAQELTPPPTSLGELRSRRIGVVSGDMRDQHLTAAGGFDLARFRTSEDLLLALAAREIDLAPVADLNLPFFLDYLQLDPRAFTAVYASPELSHEGLYLVTGTRTSRETVRQLQRALEAVRSSGFIDQSYRSYAHPERPVQPVDRSR